MSDFVYLGRIKDLKSVMKTSTLQSRQMGKRENKVINIDGRVQFDLLQVNTCIHALTKCSWTENGAYNPEYRAGPKSTAHQMVRVCSSKDEISMKKRKLD